jgi:hypothetical protein
VAVRLYCAEFCPALAYTPSRLHLPAVPLLHRTAHRPAALSRTPGSHRYARRCCGPLEPPLPHPADSVLWRSPQVGPRQNAHPLPGLTARPPLVVQLYCCLLDDDPWDERKQVAGALPTRVGFSRSAHTGKSSLPPQRRRDLTSGPSRQRGRARVWELRESGRRQDGFSKGRDISARNSPSAERLRGWLC